MPQLKIRWYDNQNQLQKQNIDYAEFINFMHELQMADAKEAWVITHKGIVKQFILNNQSRLIEAAQVYIV